MSQPPPPDRPGQEPAGAEQPPSPYEPPLPPGLGPPPADPGPRWEPAPGWAGSGSYPGPGPHATEPGGHYGHQPSYAPQVPYGQYGPPPEPPRHGTNVAAILALVFAFVFAPAGIVLGHVARRQIRRTGEAGDQLATWGLILGYVFTALYVLACLGWIALVVWAGTDSGTGSYR
ncbi:hypothetical protein AWW66_00775 [Micromonospora rosaria]|uniref:DUF4190 domain-containing protein n=1 Tax=Micromonospora rosaria TaxID=47874 RepID=A0A136PZ68_9ACTN|nr:DUF4190 domain-containing protein [Micromonospora rosaria]KXK63755.1 hypothetical protein AWW66_00775 [Micromonospora rosaria]